MYELIAFCKWCQELSLPELAANIKNLGFDGVDLPYRLNAPITHQTGPDKLPEAKRIFFRSWTEIGTVSNSTERGE